MVQVLDYNDIVETLITYLQSQNTSGAAYDLSLSLPTAMNSSNIMQKNLEIYNPSLSELPGWFLRLNRKNGDEARTVGRGSNVSREVTFFIDAVGVYSGYDESDIYLSKMIRNLETNLRENIDLNNYTSTNGNNKTSIVSLYPDDIAFETIQEEESPFNRAATITVRVNCFIQ